MRAARALTLAAGLWGAAGAAQALTCSATMSDIDFGAISVRAGVTNATSGALRIDCTGAGPLEAVGVCARFGTGSGGTSLSPRRMRRADGGTLEYELRSGGNGPAFPTWTEAFLLVPVTLGSGSAVATVYADIVSSGVSTGTGFYLSTFSGAGDVQVTYDVASCQSSGPAALVGDFTVSADVRSSCEVDASALDFGGLAQVITGAVPAEATLNVRCTAATAYAIRLDNGQGAGATGPEDRRMTSPLGQLSYGLYLDPARSAPWGDLPSNDLDAQGAGANQAFTIYGRIHAGQSVTPGLYTDSVVVTIEY